MVRSKGMKVLAATAVLSAALGFMSPAAVLSPLAATGSVNGTDVNVRGEASTTSSVVGTVSSKLFRSETAQRTAMGIHGIR